jgi:hypothetical protein
MARKIFIFARLVLDVAWVPIEAESVRQEGAAVKH